MTHYIILALPSMGKLPSTPFIGKDPGEVSKIELKKQRRKFLACPLLKTSVDKKVKLK